MKAHILEHLRHLLLGNVVALEYLVGKHVVQNAEVRQLALDVPLDEGSAQLRCGRKAANLATVLNISKSCQSRSCTSEHSGISSVCCVL